MLTIFGERMKNVCRQLFFALVLLVAQGASDAIALGSGDTFFLEGLELDAQGRTEEAIVAYNEAIRMNPDDYEAYLNRGADYVLLDDLERAVADFSDVIRLHSTNTDAWYNRGSCRAEMGLYVEAIADYSEALRLDPQDADAYYNRGYALLRQGRDEEALDDFRSVLRLQPTAGDAREQLGLTLWERGDMTQACPQLEDACALGACEGLQLAREKRHCR